MAEIKYCPNCGAPKKKPTDQFCGQCGITYDRTPKPQLTQQDLSDDKLNIIVPIPRKYIVYIVIAIVAVVAFVIIVQLSGTSSISSTGIHFGIAGKYVNEKLSYRYIELYPDGTFYVKGDYGNAAYAAEGTYKVVGNIVRLCQNLGCSELTISNNDLIDSSGSHYKKV